MDHKAGLEADAKENRMVLYLWKSFEGHDCGGTLGWAKGITCLSKLPRTGLEGKGARESMNEMVRILDYFTKGASKFCREYQFSDGSTTIEWLDTPYKDGELPASNLAIVPAQQKEKA